MDKTAPAAASCYALLPCAGVGSRCGTALPKQYHVLAGQALLWHTLAAFARCAVVRHTLIVIAPDDAHFHSLPPPHDVPESAWSVQRAGAASRAGSVLGGLRALSGLGAQPHDWVLVHDAARCLITPALIERLFEACRAEPTGGLLALPLNDTLKSARPDAQGAPRACATIARSDKWLAQTPQMFRHGLLLQALEQGLREAPEALTDEASAIERMGLQALLVRGSARNFKVTWPEDLKLAQALLQTRCDALSCTD